MLKLCIRLWSLVCVEGFRKVLNPNPEFLYFVCISDRGWQKDPFADGAREKGELINMRWYRRLEPLVLLSTVPAARFTTHYHTIPHVTTHFMCLTFYQLLSINLLQI